MEQKIRNEMCMHIISFLNGMGLHGLDHCHTLCDESINWISSFCFGSCNHDTIVYFVPSSIHYKTISKIFIDIEIRQFVNETNTQTGEHLKLIYMNQFRLPDRLSCVAFALAARLHVHFLIQQTRKYIFFFFCRRRI